MIQKNNFTIVSRFAGQTVLINAIERLLKEGGASSMPFLFARIT